MMKSPEKFKDFLMGFKENIDQNKVSKSNIRPAGKIIKENPDAFEYSLIMSKSSAAAGVSQWAKNIVLYWEVIQIIVPKRKLVADSEARLSVANQKLTAIMEIVNKLKS